MQKSVVPFLGAIQLTVLGVTSIDFEDFQKVPCF